MSDINHILISGRLAKDPIPRATPSGTNIAEITLVSNTSSKNADGTRVEKAAYYYVTVYGSTADFATRYLTKGRKILVQGELRQDAWVDTKTGQNRYKDYIIGREIQFLDTKPQDTTANQSPTYTVTPQQREQHLADRAAYHHQQKQNAYQPEPSDNIPF